MANVALVGFADTERRTRTRRARPLKQAVGERLSRGGCGEPWDLITRSASPRHSLMGGGALGGATHGR